MDTELDSVTDRSLPRGTCPRCGEAWVGRRSGRPRKWCSQRCRRAAYEERRAAANGAIAYRDPPPARPIDRDLAVCVQRVVASPSASRRLLRALGEKPRLTEVAHELRWEATRDELDRLINRVVSELTLDHTRRCI